MFFWEKGLLQNRVLTNIVYSWYNYYGVRREGVSHEAINESQFKGFASNWIIFQGTLHRSRWLWKHGFFPLGNRWQLYTADVINLIKDDKQISSTINVISKLLVHKDEIVNATEIGDTIGYNKIV